MPLGAIGGCLELGGGTAAEAGAVIGSSLLNDIGLVRGTLTGGGGGKGKGFSGSFPAAARVRFASL